MKNKLFFAIAAAVAIFSMENVFGADIGAMKIWGAGGLRERISMYNNFVAVQDFKSANEQIDAILAFFPIESIRNSSPARAFLFGPGRFLAGGDITNYKKLLEAKKKPIVKDASVKLAQDELKKIQDALAKSNEGLTQMQTAGITSDAARAVLDAVIIVFNNQIKSSIDTIKKLLIPGLSATDRNEIQVTLVTANSILDQAEKNRTDANNIINNIQKNTTTIQQELAKLQAFVDQTAAALNLVKAATTKANAATPFSSLTSALNNLRNRLIELNDTKRIGLGIDANALNTIKSEGQKLLAQAIANNAVAERFINSLPAALKDFITPAQDGLTKVQVARNAAAQTLTKIRASRDKVAATTLFQVITNSLASMKTAIDTITNLLQDAAITPADRAAVDGLLAQAKTLESQTQKDRTEAQSLIDKIQPPKNFVKPAQDELAKVQAARNAVTQTLINIRASNDKAAATMLLQGITNSLAGMKNAIDAITNLLQDAAIIPADRTTVNGLLTQARTLESQTQKDRTEAQSLIDKIQPPRNIVKEAQDEFAKVQEHFNTINQIYNNIKAATVKTTAEGLFAEFKKLQENIFRSIEKIHALYLGTTDSDRAAMNIINGQILGIEKQVNDIESDSQKRISQMQEAPDLITPANNEFAKVQTNANSSAKILDEIKKSGNKVAATAILPRFDGVLTNIRNSINVIEGLLKNPSISAADNTRISGLLKQSRGIEAQVIRQRSEAQDFIDKMPTPTTGDGQVPTNNLVKQAQDELAKVQPYRNSSGQLLDSIVKATNRTTANALLPGFDKLLENIKKSIEELGKLEFGALGQDVTRAAITNIIKQVTEIENQIIKNRNDAQAAIDKMQPPPQPPAEPKENPVRLNDLQAKVNAQLKTIANSPANPDTDFLKKELIKFNEYLQDIRQDQKINEDVNIINRKIDSLEKGFAELEKTPINQPAYKGVITGYTREAFTKEELKKLLKDVIALEDRDKAKNRGSSTITKYIPDFTNIINKELVKKAQDVQNSMFDSLKNFIKGDVPANYATKLGELLSNLIKVSQMGPTIVEQPRIGEPVNEPKQKNPLIEQAEKELKAAEDAKSLAETAFQNIKAKQGDAKVYMDQIDTIIRDIGRYISNIGNIRIPGAMKAVDAMGLRLSISSILKAVQAIEQEVNDFKTQAIKIVQPEPVTGPSEPVKVVIPLREQIQDKLDEIGSESSKVETHLQNIKKVNNKNTAKTYLNFINKAAADIKNLVESLEVMKTNAKSADENKQINEALEQARRVANQVTSKQKEAQSLVDNMQDVKKIDSGSSQAGPVTFESVKARYANLASQNRADLEQSLANIDENLKELQKIQDDPSKKISNYKVNKINDILKDLENYLISKNVAALKVIYAETRNLNKIENEGDDFD